MAPEQAPAFQFYPRDFLSDVNVSAMTLEERGAYITLLCHCWTETTISIDPASLARILKCSEKTLARIWPAIRACFVEDGGHLRQKRLDRERQKQSDHREKRKMAADRRWKVERDAHALHVQSKSDALPSSSASSICNLPTAVGSTPPPTSRSKRPIFTGQRLTVFEWQLDDLSKMLGVYGDAFDLHEWFFALDQSAVDQGLIVPKRDGGDWLQSQLLAEAQRRGLPLRMASAVPAAGKLTTRLASAIANIKAEEEGTLAPKRLQ